MLPVLFKDGERRTGGHPLQLVLLTPEEDKISAHTGRYTVRLLQQPGGDGDVVHLLQLVLEFVPVEDVEELFLDQVLLVLEHLAVGPLEGVVIGVAGGRLDHVEDGLLGVSVEETDCYEVEDVLVGEVVEALVDQEKPEIDGECPLLRGGK